MRKLLSLIVVFLLYFSVIELLNSKLSAQTYFGLKASFGNSRVAIDNGTVPAESTKSFWGNSFSILNYYSIGNNMQFGLEPGWVERGGVFEWWHLLYEPREYYIQYLEIPIFLKYSIPLGNEKLQLFGKLGYSVSITLDSFSVLRQDTGDIIYYKLHKHWLSDNDHGFHLAAGILYSLNHFEFISELSFYNGFVNINPATKSKNRVFNFSIGLMYQPTKKNKDPLPITP